MLRYAKPAAGTNLSPHSMAISATSPGCVIAGHPFDRLAQVPDQDWLEKLFRLPNTRAASAALERTLARLAPTVPSAGEVAGIYKHFRVPPRRARPISIALWSRMYHHCRRNGVGSDDELRYLNALLVSLELRKCDVDIRQEDEPSLVRETR
jgi:hypothetical protein